MIYKLTVLLFLLLLSHQTFCQVNKSDSVQAKILGNALRRAIDDADSLRRRSDSLSLVIGSMTGGPDAAHTSSKKTTYEIVTNLSALLALALLVFGGLLVGGVFIFLYKLEKGLGNYAFQTVGLVLVIVAALFLIVTGYDKDQITPIIGLLGTVVGFIFGSNTSQRQDGSSQQQKKGSDPNE